MSTLGKRLKEARVQSGFSQEQLGIEAGLEPASASARMNRYELGKRKPDPVLVEKFGEVLNLPTSYFYSTDDHEAELLATFHRLPKSGKTKALQSFKELAAELASTRRKS